MKRRQRKPVLDINNEQQSESPRGGRWQNKYQQIAVDHPEQNGNLNNNPLANLLGEYNSDSDTESDIKQQDCSNNKLNDKVNDFLKEIQMIAPDITDTKNTAKITAESNISLRANQTGQNETSNCSWQECIDETTGYPYYWHIETNEVTWEMPEEFRIYMNKCGQNNESKIQQTHQTHLPAQHAQIQWANYLPNTYPEMQTNIPEGMIPKEVVARNRNRQVGVPKNRREDVERTTQVAKKTGTEDYDSGEEKIEMITSFGNEESESETSDNDSELKKNSSSFEKTSAMQRNVKKLSIEKNVCGKNEEEEILSIGPSLPDGIIPMIHGPENVVENVDEMISNRKGIDEKIMKETVSSKMENNNCTINSKIVKETEDSVDEIEILEKLKNQAKLLQALGGQVPPSVETLIKNDEEFEVPGKRKEKGKEKEAKEEKDKGEEGDEDDEKEEAKEEEEEEEHDDIISQIEKEMPVDHVDSVDRIIDKKDVEKKRKEFQISLVAGYSDDSDIEEETSPKKLTSTQPLFPILTDYSLKEIGKESLLKISNDVNIDKDIENLENLDKSDVKKLSNSNVENANELMKKIDEYSSRENSSDRTEAEINGFETSENNKTEIETTRQNSFLDNLVEIPAKGFQRKKRIAFDVVPNKIARSKCDTPIIQSSSRPEPTSLNFSSSISSSDDSERHGFGFHKETKKQGDSDSCDYSTCDINRDKIITGEQKEISKETTTKKGINFVKGETTQSSIVQTEPVVVNKKPEDNKELKELTDIVMEKIKFLSEGSQNISAIQIMIIQLQTLVGAWEAGDLKENYLYEWLKGTGHELARLEEAAAPPGWDCHWDRSHKRYYYRNSATGEAQWTYPEADVVGGTEEMDLCTTPPPPEDEELQIIEESAVAATDNTTSIKTNDNKSDTMLTSISIPTNPTTTSMPMSMLTITGDNKIIQITRDEYKSLEAPPPPKISNPSPPPPPRIFAEDLKKGKKRRCSTNERNYSDSKKEKTIGGDIANANCLSSSSSSSSFASSPSFDTKDNVDPPLPPSPPKNTTQPPLPPNPPHPTIVPNPPNSEPLPPGVDPKDMPAYPLPAVTGLEPTVVYAGTTRQNNQIYATTIAERGITVPLIDHRSAIIQGQLMHYPTYQHLHNQAMIAAAGSLTGQETAVQFMITDYGQVYTNAQVIAKPPIKSQNESLGSALDSFYSDIATIEKSILAEQDHQLNVQQDFDVSSREAAAVAATPPPPIAIPNPAVVVAPSIAEIDQQNTSIEPMAGGKEKKRKRTKVGIGKKQKEMSSMVAKWQKAQQDFEDSE